MKIVVIGSKGQLGTALRHTAKDSLNSKNAKVIFLSRDEIDLTDPGSCKRIVELYQPDWVINAAAYTNVDQCENDFDLAQTVNASAPAAFAEALLPTRGRLLHISTDFVFDGLSTKPYKVEDFPNPLSSYGKTKEEGERLVLERLGPTNRVSIIRTSWLYGPSGNNFLRTILRVISNRESIGVVSDQIGCPTNSVGLAKVCWKAIEYTMQTDDYLPPILHWSDAGVASWYDFAHAIVRNAKSRGLDKNRMVVPISTDQYPTLAVRPAFSLLDSSKTVKLLTLEQRHWTDELEEVFKTFTTINNLTD